MKNIIFLLFFLCANMYFTFSQACKINDIQVPPLKDKLFKNSVNYKDLMYFYSASTASDSLLIRFSFLDVYKRTPKTGDSAKVLLKNKHSITLLNVREFVPRHDNYNLIFIDMDLFFISFTAWISKNDVRELSQNSISNLVVYVRNDDNDFAIKKGKAEKKRNDYSKLSGGFVWKKNVKNLANCALNL